MSETQGNEYPDKKTTRFWAASALSAISEMRHSKKTGLLPKSEGWRNVLEHELVEAEAADILAEKLGISHKERKNLRIAALLHDVYKRKEIERAREGGASSFDSSAEDQANWIKSLGYSEDVVELVQSVGHTSLEEFSRDFDTIPTVRKIIHYADDITSGSEVVPLDERISQLERKPEYKELNESGRAIFGKTYSEVQREVSKRIEEEFASRLGVSDPTTIPKFVKNCIDVRIAQSE